MKNNIKKYILFSLVCALFLGSFAPVFAVKHNAEYIPNLEQSGSIIEVVNIPQTSSVKVSLIDSNVNCSAFEAGHLQGSVVNLNSPATCFKLISQDMKPVSVSVHVVNIKNNSIVKVVRKNSSVSEPLYQPSTSTSLPSLPGTTNELVFGALLFSLGVKLSYGKKGANLKVLFGNLTFNRFSVLRC